MLPPPTGARAKPSVAITSSWCKRALRPLTSIIVRLERHWKDTRLDSHARDRAGLAGPEPTPKSRTRRSAGNNNGTVDGGSDSESSREDPTWAPGRTAAGARRVKHRYSGRNGAARSRVRVVARSPEAEGLRPGEFTVSTPLILGRGRGGVRDEEDGAGSDAGEECVEQQGSQAVGRKRFAPLSWEGQNRLQQQYTGSGDGYDDPAYRAIVQGIRITWITFLTTTACQPQKPRGARSLMSMALDKTSEYILREQERLDNLDEKDADTDVADYIITELENTYAFYDRGWEPLKELVRAHGIRLMCEAVRKRHFSPRLSRFLILNAASASFYDAAEALLSSLLSLSPSIPPPGRLDNSLMETESYFSALNIYVERTGRRGIWYQEMATLIARGAVPVEWMAADAMTPFLTTAMLSISSDDSCSIHSARFITTVLHAALGMNVGSGQLSPRDVSRQGPRKHTRLAQSKQNEAISSAASDIPKRLGVGCYEFISTALTNTVSSILTILCGAHLTRLDDAANDIDSPDIATSPMSKIISLVSTTVQQEIEQKYLHGVTGHFSSLQSLRIGYILIADYILNYQSVIGLPPLVNFERFLSLLSKRGELVSDFSILVLQISRCWGRAHGTDGFDQIKRLTDSLTSTDTDMVSSYPIVHAILNKIAVEIALNFAELTCLRDHHDWALHIQEKVAGLGLSSQSSSLESDDGDGPAVPWTPSLALPSRGFRWEDGIGEWVANSPVLERGRRKGALVLGAVEVLVGGDLGRSSGSASRRVEEERSIDDDDGDDDGLQGSEEEFEGSNSAPSSVHNDGDAEQQGILDTDDDEDDGEAGDGEETEQQPDHSNGSRSENSVSDSETVASPPRAKRKSLLADAVYSTTKRRKHQGVDEISTPRRRLRRRRTTPRYMVYRDEYEEEDEGSNVDSSSSQPSSRTGSLTRRRALQERNAAVNLMGHDHVPRPNQRNVEVVIKIPLAKESPKSKPRGVRVVTPHDGWGSGWKGASCGVSMKTRDSVRRQQDGQGEAADCDGEDVDVDVDDEKCSDKGGNSEDEEEDVFTNAPILRDRIHASRRWSSFSYSNSPASSSTSSRAVSHHGSRSSSRQPRPRMSHPGLAKSRSSLASASARREIVPCSQESSDDELSFV